MNLEDLASATYWKNLCEEEQRCKLTFVLPTGRASESITPHLALSTDGLLLPELTVAVDLLVRAAGLPGVDVETVLDIDFYEVLSAESQSERNVFVIGSADVNLAAALLLDKTRSYDTWHAGFTKPYEQPSIMGVGGARYMFTVSPNTGLLAMYPNVWARKPRIAVLCAGLFAIGTIAALRLLLDYVTGNGDGNNRINSELPIKIVDGVPRLYRNLALKPIADCFPPMDVLNITGINIRE
jgi:hypothetical protein